MKKLQVAMLSKWHVHAEEYARTIQSFPDAEITAVWDEDAVRGAEWAQALGAAFEPDLDALLAREDVQAVAVDTPTSMHEEVIIKAARAGKHIFTEKVLAATLDEAKRIAAAVEQAGVKFCISFPQLTWPKVLYAKQVIEEGLLGQVSLLRIRNAHGGVSQDWLPAYWYDLAQAQGGAMLDLGAHPNYQAAFLLGKPQRAVAMFDRMMCKQDVEDNAVSVFAFENNALAVLETGFITPHSPWVMEIHGTQGSLMATGDRVRIRSEKLPMRGWYEPDAAEMPPRLPMPLRMFVDGVLLDQPIAFGLDEALMLTEMMEMNYVAQRGGHVAEALS